MILTNNNFTFEEHNYLQFHVMATGTRMAPFYANLFMERLESCILEKVDNKPTVWWRFIDDVFVL